MSFRQFLGEALQVSGFTATEEQLEQFVQYYELLADWNQRMNLTAITEPQEVAVKHMVDSLLCFDRKHFPVGARVIDVGTGAGFPGIPLKIMYPDLKIVLFDSLKKRLNFLQAVVDRLGLTGIQCVHGRAEDGGRDSKWRDGFDVAVSRAVARMNVLVELCLPFVRPGGYFIALKGAQYQEELTESQQAIRLLGGKAEVPRAINLPGLSEQRGLLCIKKVKPTPKTYPRRPAVITKQPL